MAPGKSTKTRRPVVTANIEGSVSPAAAPVMAALESVLMSRSRLASAAGLTFGGARDVGEACGYPLELSVADYLPRYRRQDIARRIVHAYPNATWRDKPLVYDTETAGSESPFEKAWDALVASARVYHYFKRVDRLAGVGRFGALVMGVNDGKELFAELKRATVLMYMVPYGEGSVGVDGFVTDRKDPRYGLPARYTIRPVSASSAGYRAPMAAGGIGPVAGTLKAHWTRVIHVADDCEESDVFGVPRLECVYNRLLDLEKVLGGSAEAYWRTGFAGLAFKKQADARFSQDTTALNEQIENYVHGMDRTLRLQGIDVQELLGRAVNPEHLMAAELQMVSAASGIPVRILTGSEASELASSQDERNWNSRVDERRRDWAEPSMLRPFIDRMILIGVLPPPKGGEYQVEWPDINAPSDGDKAKVARDWTEALARYWSSGVAQVMPPREYFVNVMGMTPDEADAILKAAEEQDIEEDEDLKDGEGEEPPAPNEPNEDEDQA